MVVAPETGSELGGATGAAVGTEAAGAVAAAASTDFPSVSGDSEAPSEAAGVAVCIHTLMQRVHKHEKRDVKKKTRRACEMKHHAGTV